MTTLKRVSRFMNRINLERFCLEKPTQKHDQSQFIYYIDTKHSKPSLAISITSILRNNYIPSCNIRHILTDVCKKKYGLVWYPNFTQFICYGCYHQFCTSFCSHTIFFWPHSYSMFLKYLTEKKLRFDFCKVWNMNHHLS